MSSDEKFGNTVVCINWKIGNTLNELVDLVKGILDEY